MFTFKQFQKLDLILISLFSSFEERIWEIRCDIIWRYVLKIADFLERRKNFNKNSIHWTDNVKLCDGPRVTCRETNSFFLTKKNNNLNSRRLKWVKSRKNWMKCLRIKKKCTFSDDFNKLRKLYCEICFGINPIKEI